jgi:hypothetical protein
MAKGQEEDKLWAQTLMTIEIININDLALEKQNHEKFINSAQVTLKVLEQQEAKFLTDVEKRERKKKRYNTQRGVVGAG